MDNLIRDMFSSISAIYVIAIISSLLSLTFNVLFMFAIQYDCKARENKNTTMWMILCFFFPLIAGIVYACKRNSSNTAAPIRCDRCGAYSNPAAEFCLYCGNPIMKNTIEKRKKDQKNAHTLFGFAVGTYVINIILSIAVVVICFNIMSDVVLKGLEIGDEIIGGDSQYFDNFDFDDDFDDWKYHFGYNIDGIKTYYDRNGKAYTDADDVLFFDKAGNTYTYDDDEYVYKSANGREYDFNYCYVDEYGYFIFDEAGYKNDKDSTIHYSASKSSDDVSIYVDDNDTRYVNAYAASWDENGNIVDSYSGSMIFKKK